MMNPHLLKAILADPADDEVRLIMADWLEEHDQPERAEFIRVQIELKNPHWKDFELFIGKLLVPPRFKEWENMNRRERQLLRGNGAAWAGEAVREVTGVCGLNWKWSRGFVEWIKCPFDRFYEWESRLRKEQPITKVELSTYPKIETVERSDGFGWTEWVFHIPGLDTKVYAMTTFPARIKIIAEKIFSKEYPGIDFTFSE